jgi:lactoylglutathione lyase
MELTLLVVRTGNPAVLADFYTSLGLSFEYHRHGTGPWHYSAHIGRTILEIYPLSKTQMKADEYLRLGFSIDQFDTTIELLRSKNTRFVTEPTQTEWGLMAIIEDPDGRKIELYKNNNSGTHYIPGVIK